MKRHVYLVDHSAYSDLQERLASAQGDAVAECAVLRELCAVNRINAMAAVTSAEHGWLGASFSIAEILTVLYFDVLSACSPDDPEREYVVLGKGHAAAMQYAALAGLGRFPVQDLCLYKQPHGPQAHTDISTPGIEINSGSLGQALSKCCGLALGGARRVFCVLGDGELQEGQNFEALQTIAHRDRRNVATIVDRNGLQSDSAVSDIKGIHDLEGVLQGFGFDVRCIDGNSVEHVRSCLTSLHQAHRPVAIIADTNKGAGVSFMSARTAPRRSYAWHGGIPSPAEYRAALRELRNSIRHTGVLQGIEAFLARDAGVAGGPVPTPSGAPTCVSTGTAFGAHLCDLAAAGTDVVALDADLEKPCRLAEFAQRFPDQFIEMGISEQDMVSCAGGLALRGRLPIVNTYAAFLRRALEQIYVNATERTRIVYAGHYAGLCYTTDGKTHQCTGDIGMMRTIPGMHVLYPAFPEEVPEMLAWYMHEVPRDPLYIRLHRTPAPDIRPAGTLRFRHGHGVRVRVRDSQTAVLTCGPHTTASCARAIDQLNAPCDLYAVPTLRFLDAEFARELLDRHDTFAVVEENSAAGGLFDEVCAVFAHVAEQDPGRQRPRVVRRAVDGLTFSTRDPDGLYCHFGLDADSLRVWLTELLCC